MVKPPSFSITVPSSAPQKSRATTPTSQTPKLLWPTLDNTCEAIDLHRFPQQLEETLRYKCGEFGACSENFMSAIRNALDRVWLIDRYLLKLVQGVNQSFSSVFERSLLQTKASDIRLLTTGKSGHKEQIKRLHEIQEARCKPPRTDKFTIEVRIIREGPTQTRFPHDRFALIDDELWHWGANVGGTHHEVNAYSHGWMANETGAVQYFQRLWESSESVQ